MLRKKEADKSHNIQGIKLSWLKKCHMFDKQVYANDIYSVSILKHLSLLNHFLVFFFSSLSLLMQFWCLLQGIGKGIAIIRAAGLTNRFKVMFIYAVLSLLNISYGINKH